MRHQITFIQRRNLAQKILGLFPAGTTAARQAIAQHVGFGENNQIRRIKSMLQPQRNQADLCATQLFHGCIIVARLQSIDARRL